MPFPTTLLVAAVVVLHLATPSFGAPQPPACSTSTCLTGVQSGVMDLNCGGSGEIFTDFVLRAYYSQKDGANFNQNADLLAEPRTTLNCSAGAVISKKATDWYADVVPYKPETESAGALKGTVAKPGCALGKKATTTVLAACEKKGASACFINVTQIAADMKTNFPEMKDSTFCTGSADNVLTLDIQMTCVKGGIDPLTVLVLLFIIVISLAMGTTVVKDDFRAIWKDKKRAFGLGLLSQYIFMPLFSYAMCFAFDFSPRAAIGVMICGMMPGGSTSNLYTYWVKGNVALSVAMSTVSTITSMFMIPLLYTIYVTTTFATKAGVKLPWLNLIVAMFALMVPVPLGMYIRVKNAKAALIVEKVGNVLGAIFLIVAVILGVLDAPELIGNPHLYWRSWILGCIYQPIGCVVGYLLARVAKLDRRDCRAVSLECGVQNYAIAIAIAALSFSGCTRVDVQSFVLVGSFWYVINSFLCTLFIRFWCIRVDGFGKDGMSEKQTLAQEGATISPVESSPAP